MQDSEAQGGFDGEFYRQFYHEDLYLVKTSEAKAAELVHEGVEDLGTVILLSANKQSDCLLLFSYPGKDHIPNKDKDLLINILQAVGFSFEKTAWLNTALYPQADWQDILLLSPATKIVAFGIPEQYLPQPMKEGQLYTVQNRRLIYAAPLVSLQTNIESKKILWKALKEVFGV